MKLRLMFVALGTAGALVGASTRAFAADPTGTVVCPTLGAACTSSYHFNGVGQADITDACFFNNPTAPQLDQFESCNAFRPPAAAKTLELANIKDNNINPVEGTIVIVSPTGSNEWSANFCGGIGNGSSTDAQWVQDELDSNGNTIGSDETATTAAIPLISHGGVADLVEVWDTGLPGLNADTTPATPTVNPCSGSIIGLAPTAATSNFGGTVNITFN